jgi:hypothetical protein
MILLFSLGRIILVSFKTLQSSKCFFNTPSFKKRFKHLSQNHFFFLTLPTCLLIKRDKLFIRGDQE